jgi:hypothetical protein
MKNHINSFLFLAMIVFCFACSEDEPKAPVSTISHAGDKWNISSVEYNIVDQNLSSPTIKNGTALNAGAFYFDGAKGSFDIRIDNIHKEDVFGFQLDNADVTITSIQQSVQGASISQNVIVLSDEKDITTMTLSGTITKQAITSQFVLTGTFVLTKE